MSKVTWKPVWRSGLPRYCRTLAFDEKIRAFADEYDRICHVVRVEQRDPRCDIWQTCPVSTYSRMPKKVTWNLEPKCQGGGGNGEPTTFRERILVFEYEYGRVRPAPLRSALRKA